MNETIFENIGFFLNQEDLKIGASEPVSFDEDEHFQLDVIDLPLHFKCDAEKDGIVCRLYQRHQFGISEENPICTIRFSADGSEVMGEESDDNSVFRFGTAEDSGESGNVAMARVFLRTASFLRRYSIENHLVDEWEYYDAETDGILVKNKEDSTIQLKMVTRRNRPSLIGTTLFGGMEMCRPYWDEMIASMMSENASFEELLEKAEDGDEDAMLKVADAYYNGDDFDGIEEDKGQALFWYRILADKDHSTAQFNLGIMYMKGEAVPQSFEKALEWMKKANENGDDDAEAYIERFSAIVNSQKKADAGNAQAIAELAEELMRFGMMVDDECADDFLAQSVEYAKKAADAGIAKGCWILGLAYSKGRGVETDLAQSVRYYERGSELGDAACQNSLGVFYVNGEGVRKDEKRAFALFQKSAGQGYGLAMYALGRCYQFGTGCKGNMKKALEWYEKASALLDNPELDAKVAAFRQLADIDPNWGEDYDG